MDIDRVLHEIHRLGWELTIETDLDAVAERGVQLACLGYHEEYQTISVGGETLADVLEALDVAITQKMDEAGVCYTCNGACGTVEHPCLTCSGTGVA